MYLVVVCSLVRLFVSVSDLMSSLYTNACVLMLQKKIMILICIAILIAIIVVPLLFFFT